MRYVWVQSPALAAAFGVLAIAVKSKLKPVLSSPVACRRAFSTITLVQLGRSLRGSLAVGHVNSSLPPAGPLELCHLVDSVGLSHRGGKASSPVLPSTPFSPGALQCPACGTVARQLRHSISYLGPPSARLVTKYPISEYRTGPCQRASDDAPPFELPLAFSTQAVGLGRRVLKLLSHPTRHS